VKKPWISLISPLSIPQSKNLNGKHDIHDDQPVKFMVPIFRQTHIRWVPKISQNEKNMERMPPPKQAAILWEILFVLDLDPTLQEFRKKSTNIGLV
jgi:hypothetical protein